MVSDCVDAVVVSQRVKRCQHCVLAGVIVGSHGEVVHQVLMEHAVDAHSTAVALWDHFDECAVHAVLVKEHSAALELQAGCRHVLLLGVTDAADIPDAIELVRHIESLTGF